MPILIILLIIFGVGLLIGLHEFGHFYMAKRNKVLVEVFSVGFGPPIVRWRRANDETEYRISWIPLGGYVKLAGELPTGERQPQPHELWAKTPWQKFQIFVAGALMNLILAFPLCIVANLVGRYVQAPYVGEVPMPEARAGMLPGDEIVSVEGVPIKSLDDYRFQIFSHSGSAKVVVRRDGKEVELTVPIMTDEHHRVGRQDNKIAQVLPGTPAEKAGFKEGDELLKLEAEGESMSVIGPGRLLEAFFKLGGKQVTATVRNRGEIRKVEFTMPKNEVYQYEVDYSLVEPLVGSVEEGKPAFGKLKEGDRIRSVDGVPVESWAGLVEQIKKKRPSDDVAIRVLREGSEVEVRINPGLNDLGQGQLGIAPPSSQRQSAGCGRSPRGGIPGTNVIADVRKDSYYDKVGFRKGDRIKQIDDAPGDFVVGHLWMTDGRLTADKVRTVLVDRGGQSVTLRLEPSKQVVGETNFDAFGIKLYDRGNVFFRKWSLGEAMVDGIKEPWRITKLTFELLRKLVTGKVSAKNLSGPVGIFHVSYVSASVHIGNFLWLLALITVNLGIINLLPLPLLDGGHMWVLLAAEKIKGKPPSERFFMVFQYLGFAMFLVLVIFVTFNDVTRLFKSF